MLANNTLGTIDLQVFQNLSNLQTLNMSGNNLDENWIRPGIFSGLFFFKKHDFLKKFNLIFFFFCRIT